MDRLGLTAVISQEAYAATDVGLLTSSMWRPFHVATGAMTKAAQVGRTSGNVSASSKPATPSCMLVVGVGSTSGS
jgi:hypothetical protein